MVDGLVVRHAIERTKELGRGEILIKLGNIIVNGIERIGWRFKNESVSLVMVLLN